MERQYSKGATGFVQALTDLFNAGSIVTETRIIQLSGNPEVDRLFLENLARHRALELESDYDEDNY